MAQTLGTLLVDIKGDTTHLIQSFNKAETAVGKTTKSIQSGIKLAVGAFALLQGADFASNIVKQMDMITEANNKLKLSTSGVNEFATAQKELYKIAQRTNSGYAETVKLYSDLSSSMAAMGKSQDQILRTVETVNKAIAISGVNSQQAGAAILQLGQAFGSGGLKGDELTSLKENAQGLIKAIADGMGVAVGDLKELGSQGKITSEVLAQAFEKTALNVDTKFSQMKIAVSQGFTNISNSVSVLTGDFFHAIGAGEGLATTLIKISNSLDTNKNEIIKYGALTTATISKIVDNFILLGVDIKNTAELVLDGIGIMAFGALKPIASILLEITKGLESLNLSSKESLSNAQSLFDFAEKGLTNFTQSAVDNVADMDKAYLKANVSIADRVKAMENEAKVKEKITEEVKNNNTTIAKTEKETTVKVKDTLQDRINQYMNYHEKIGDYSKLWAEHERKIREENYLLKKDELDKLIELEKQSFDNKANANVYEASKTELDFQTKLLEQQADSYEKEVDLANLRYVNNVLSIEALDKTREQKDYLLMLEEQLNQVTLQRISAEDNISRLEKASEDKIGLIDYQLELADATDSWGNSLDAVAGKIGNVMGAYQKMAKANLVSNKQQIKLDTNLAKIKEQFGADSIEYADAIDEHTMKSSELKSKQQDAEIAGYSNLAGAMASAFEKGSAGAIAFTALQATLGIASSWSAIAMAWSSNIFPLNLPAVAAASSAVLPIIGQLASMGGSGGSGGGGSSSESINPKDFITTNEGKGTVLGEADQASESLKNSIELMADYAEPQFKELQAMAKYLANIEMKLGGVSSLLFKANMFDYPAIYKNNAMLWDYGINIDTAKMKDAVNGLTANLYDTIVFFDVNIRKVNDDITSQFTSVLKDIYNTVDKSASMLGLSSEDVRKSMDEAAVSIGKLSFKDKSGSEIQELLSNVFGQVADKLVGISVPLIGEFQRIGEGLFETLSRVNVGLGEAKYYAERLGSAFTTRGYQEIQNKQGDIGFELLLDSIIRAEKATFNFNDGLINIIESLNVSAEELYNYYTTLDLIRDKMIFIRTSTIGLTDMMIRGAGSIDELESGFSSFFDNFLSETDQLIFETNQLSDSFKNLGVSLPASKEDFVKLVQSIDLTTESGQKLYGRLMTLSESFANVSDKVTESIKMLEESLTKLSENGIDNLTSSFEPLMNAIKGLKDIATSFINSFSSSSLGSTRDQIKKYNELRKQFSSYFDTSGKLNASVTESQAKTLYQELSVLGTNIGKTQADLQSDLVSQFQNDLINLDLSDQILKVDIINGLGDLLGLTQAQKDELQKIASDGNITISELQNVKDLTQTQKDGILDFAKNSGYFSTEDTLKNVAELTRLQLDAARQSQARETEGLSRETLTLGDYIGTQEKVDISRLLGVSYETAEPLISKLQGMSSLDTNSYMNEIYKMVGFSAGGTTYDAVTLENINRLSPYLQNGAMNIASSIKNQAYNNNVEKQNKIASLQNEISRLTNSLATSISNYNNTYNPTILSNQSTIDWFDSQKAFYPAIMHTYIDQNKAPNVAARDAAILARDSGINSVRNSIQPKIDNATLQLKQLQGYAVGATNIPYDQIAQIHQGEMIIPKTFSEGLRTGELSLSANTPNSNVGSLNLFEGVKEIMNDVFKTFADYPKKTHDLLDDVINGRAEMRVKTI